MVRIVRSFTLKSAVENGARGPSLQNDIYDICETKGYDTFGHRRIFDFKSVQIGIQI